MHKCFISYSSKNMIEAETICQCIENIGISCWMSPRDDVPGSHFAASITQAIRNSKVLILLLSRSANDSVYIVREVNLAVASHIPIITAFLEETAISDSLDFYVSVSPWVNANNDIDTTGRRLAEAVQTLLQSDKEVKKFPVKQSDVIIDIYNEEMDWVGTALRKQVHQLGLWHKTVHCWFYSYEGESTYIWVQKRSSSKQDFPNMLDITAGRHLLVGETDRDGIKKISLELGIEVDFSSLTFLGVRTYAEHIDKFVNNEFNSVYLYPSVYLIKDFSPFPDEVSGILRIDLRELTALFAQEKDSVSSVGLLIDNDGHHVQEVIVHADDFVPRSDDYYKKICAAVSSISRGDKPVGI